MANKIVTRIAAIAATTALALGATSLATVPAEAKIRGTGTFTLSEMRKVNRQMDKQKCLTRKETRKIIHGNGTKIGKRKIEWLARDYLDFGNGEVYRDSFIVKYNRKGCAVMTIWWDYDEDAIADESLYW